MSDEDPEEAHTSPIVLSALLQYRVRKLEQGMEKVQETQAEQGRKLDDIPGFIARKFDEQTKLFNEQKLAFHNDTRGRLNLIVSAVAAISALGTVGVALASVLGQHH